MFDTYFLQDKMRLYASVRNVMIFLDHHVLQPQVRHLDLVSRMMNVVRPQNCVDRHGVVVKQCLYVDTFMITIINLVVEKDWLQFLADFVSHVKDLIDRQEKVSQETIMAYRFRLRPALFKFVSGFKFPEFEIGAKKADSSVDHDPARLFQSFLDELEPGYDEFELMEDLPDLDLLELPTKKAKKADTKRRKISKA